MHESLTETCFPSLHPDCSCALLANKRTSAVPPHPKYSCLFLNFADHIPLIIQVWRMTKIKQAERRGSTARVKFPALYILPCAITLVLLFLLFLWPQCSFCCRQYSPPLKSAQQMLSMRVKVRHQKCLSTEGEKRWLLLYSLCRHSPNKMHETAGSDVCQPARRLMKAFPVKKCLEVRCCRVQYDHLI